MKFKLLVYVFGRPRPVHGSSDNMRTAVRQHGDTLQLLVYVWLRAVDRRQPRLPPRAR